jgi:hypothetical protein
MKNRLCKLKTHHGRGRKVFRANLSSAPPCAGLPRGSFTTSAQKVAENVAEKRKKRVSANTLLYSSVSEGYVLTYRYYIIIRSKCSMFIAIDRFLVIY